MQLNMRSNFKGMSLTARPCAASRPQAVRRVHLSVRADSALIVNTKGGGHAFIGLHLAKKLISDGHKVTILNDGDKVPVCSADSSERSNPNHRRSPCSAHTHPCPPPCMQAKLEKKAPFCQYASLGADIVWGSPTDPSALPSGPFDVVYDNNGKDLDACKPLIDHFKGRVKHYVFVSSAGAYVANDVEPMHVEGDKRKASAGHVAVENYLADQGLPYTVFQPLYIYGPHTAKDCEQGFMDRVLR